MVVSSTVQVRDSMDPNTAILLTSFLSETGQLCKFGLLRFDSNYLHGIIPMS